MSCSLKAIALYNFQPSAPVELELHVSYLYIHRCVMYNSTGRVHLFVERRCNNC